MRTLVHQYLVYVGTLFPTGQVRARTPTAPTPSPVWTMSLLQSRCGHNTAFDDYILSALPQLQKVATAWAPKSSLSFTSPSITTNIRQRACERCRRQKTKCVEGRPCKRCAVKSSGQTCLDCDNNGADAQRSSNQVPLSVVHRTPQCASKTILLPDENPRAQPLTKSGILENQFGHSMWLNRKMSKKLVDGMSDELCNAVIEALEAIRICHKPSRCAERVPVPNTVHGVTLKVLDDDVSVHAYCVEELNLDACKPCGIHFNRKFAEDIMGCRSEELLTRSSLPHPPCPSPLASSSLPHHRSRAGLPGVTYHFRPPRWSSSAHWYCADHQRVSC